MRTYHTYQTEFKNAETKLRNFEAQRSKLEQGIPKEKLEKSKKFRVIEKEIQKVVRLTGLYFFHFLRCKKDYYNLYRC